MTAREFLRDVRQFFPNAGLRNASPQKHAAYCAEHETFICYNLETQCWLIETAFDYIFENELTQAVSQMSTARRPRTLATV
ncbi:hypothetical protein PCC6311_pgB051 (plasmid) [Synechococcus elongatus PCC 6311]|uniref:ANL27 n=1 Tax=Synechococcus elongatus (strain ATCC 33912 / PCC 7942 / FACHB-805) TaxID=1140 RepID=Q8KUV3_SYNE7|nr:ANL27 [Synechococcus elongatus PCC 7942 = FACHB-805]AJD58974.1 hypothetical protein M744_14130 [Synechococcus elongatus UTEX 2973]UOW72492.1 hypothetical protein PCC7943_pgB051 [Synechococcus elongatus PCC 7943]UOW75213.1 hypothetical protein PCC6311_pgB051 [Synechococcus elongatus PCC 6311]UOW77932.1 hypothetical protein PCC6301pg_B051 [Synechococcus elongatus PCC 6301]